MTLPLLVSLALVVACANPTLEEFCNERTEKKCVAPDVDPNACLLARQAEEIVARSAGCDEPYEGYVSCLNATLAEVGSCKDNGVEMDARLRGRCYGEKSTLDRCIDADAGEPDAATDAEGSLDDAGLLDDAGP